MKADSMHTARAHFMASFSERIAQWTLPMLRSCTYSARSTCARTANCFVNARAGGMLFACVT